MRLRAGGGALSLAILALLVLPVFLVKYVPLVDLAGHAGRLHILEHYADVPGFQARYELVYKPIPDLGIDLVALPLLRWMSMESALRVFVALTITVFGLGCALLSRALYGHITPLASLAMFAVYNSMFTYGYVVFHLGFGLYLVTLALWMRWTTRRTVLRIVLLSVFSVAVYLAHLGGFLFLGVSLGVLTLRTCWRERAISWRTIAGLVPLAFPVGLYLSLGTAGGDKHTILWSTAAMKLRHALTLLIGYDARVDVAVGLGLLMAVGIALVWGRMRVQPEAGLLAIVFWAAFLISPTFLLTGADADTRFVLPAGVLTLLAIRIDGKPWAGRLATGIALAVLTFRIGTIAQEWRREARLIMENIALLDQIPRNARVYPIFEGSRDPAEGKRERPLYHSVSWATVHRDAIVPTTFTVRGQHPVNERDGFWFKEYNPEISPDAFDWGPVFKNYDVIWYFGSNPAVTSHLEPECTLLAANDRAKLYRVNVKP